MDAVELAEELLADEDPQRALTLCEERLEAAGLRVQRFPELGAIVARRGDGGLALSGHVDVVPVTPEAWERPAFGASIDEDGILFGRGASDMRGPVASMLAALATTDAPARIAITTDEETRMDGVRALVEEGVFDGASLIVVGEPTELDLAVAGKGLVWARVSAEGERGHASTPRGEGGRGGSAAERLVDALAGLEARPLRIEHPRLGQATLAISGLDSEPTPFNVLAGDAQARLDLRFPPPKTPQDAERALRSRLGLPHEGVELSFAKREPAFLGDEPTGKRAREALGQAGIEAELIGVGYATEAGHWQRSADTLILGPGSIERAHAPDEFVTREELDAGQRAYEMLIESWAP